MSCFETNSTSIVEHQFPPSDSGQEALAGSGLCEKGEIMLAKAPKIGAKLVNVNLNGCNKNVCLIKKTSFNPIY